MKLDVSALFSGGRERKRPDPWLVPLKTHESLLAGLIGMGGAMLVAAVFYRDLAFVLFFAPLGLPAISLYAHKRATDRRELFLLQFRDLLYYLSAALAAGKALEPAFLDATASLSAQYGRGDTILLASLRHVHARMALRQPIETELAALAEETELEDVRSFADVIAVCRRSGGNLVEVMQQSVRVLREKMEIRREMETAWAAKRLEQRILCVSPVFLILLVRLGSGDFMDPMYQTPAGRLMMTLALGLICVGFMIGERIMRAQV